MSIAKFHQLSFRFMSAGFRLHLRKCTGASLSFLCLLASMTTGTGGSCSSSFRGFLTDFTLLLGRPSLGLLWGTRIVCLVCPFVSFSPPRSRGCNESKGCMGLLIPSDFSTRLPFDFVPCRGNNRLGIGNCGCVCACVPTSRSEGRSENRCTRFLNWS